MITQLNENKKSLLDFGAVGDGIVDDSAAFLCALGSIKETEQKTLVIPGDYNFNLGNETIDFDYIASEILLEFEGGYLSNANLIGSRTRIKADRIKIFDNVSLCGTFFSVTDYAYPEWYGVFPGDINVDVVEDALEKLDTVFYDISLGAGDYYTQKGNYMVKGLKGLSMAKTKVIMETDDSGVYIFSLGKVSGSVEERNYDYNYIKDITLVMSTPSGCRLTGNRGIIVGAAHKPVVENVKVILFGDKLQFSKSDLESFLYNPSKMDEANVGLEFDGDSELTFISNFFTMSDIGILFTTFCDFVVIRDYMNWCGLNGLANVYYKSEALPSQNILFTGAQSWNQGLYGLYTENSITFNSFPSVKFENVRIEQLVSDLIIQNKLQGANIWIGTNETITNLQFENIWLAGVSNGVHIGSTMYGRVSIQNIITWGDPIIEKEYALDINYRVPEASFLIFLKNVSLPDDTDSNFSNANIIYNGFVQEQVHEEKNLFVDCIVVGGSVPLKKYNPQRTESTYIEQVKIFNDNENYIPLIHSVPRTGILMKYFIEFFAGSIYDTFEFVIFESGFNHIIKDSQFVSMTLNQFIPNKLNLIMDTDSGVIFIFNRLGVVLLVNIFATEVKMN